ncbi:MAG: hypothetical protein F4X92_00020 [Gammaproteobacteria bacterium]|nr:hypothetical protein [Gammaproteobacteria bacterium]
MKEIDSDLERVRDRMNHLVVQINELLRNDAGPDGLTGDYGVTCRARTHVYGGMMSVRYMVRQGLDGKHTTRSSLMERTPRKASDWGSGLSSPEPAGSGEARWITEVADHRKKTLLELDRERRMLNHQYRTLFAERRSLRQLHAEEKALKALWHEAGF